MRRDVEREADFVRSKVCYLSRKFYSWMSQPSTVGMDIQFRNIMWSTLERLKQELGITIFLTTHYLEEAGRLSDTICFMANGKRVLQGSPKSLRQYTHKDVIRIATTTEDDSAAFVHSCSKQRLTL